MVYNDRLKKAFYALVKSSVPRLDYFTTYSARVVSQSSSEPTSDPEKGDLLDVNPDDPRLPPMGGVPLRLGIPGTRVQLKPGCRVLVGWANGDPSQPYCSLHDVDDGAISITVVAQTIQLGGTTLDPLQDGLVHGRGISDYSGLPYWQLGNTSSVVLGKK